MATKGATTDLVIRAAEIKTKPLDDLLVVLQRLTTALDELDANGGPASRSMSELTAEAKKFETVVSELAGRKALLESFKAASEGASLAKKSALEARKALEAFQATLAEKKKDRTPEQVAQLEALRKALNAAEAASRRADRTLGTNSDKLEALGVSAADATEEVARLAAAERQASAGLDRAIVSTQRYAEALREQKAAAEAAQQASQKAALIGPGRDEFAAQKQLRQGQEAAALAARKAEQAESDRLAVLEQQGRARQLAAGQAQAASELATLRDYEAAEARRLKGIAETTAALNKQREAERQAASDLRVSGVEAGQAAGRYRALAQAAERVAKEATPATRSLADAVGNLVDPSRRAALSMTEVARSLGEVRARQAILALTTEQSEDQLKQLAADYQFLNRALQETERQAKAVQGYREAQKQFEATGAALERAQQALAGYAQQARAAGTSDDAIAQGLREQRALLDSLVAQYQRQAQAVRAMGTALRTAGVDLRDLAQAESAVIAQARALRAALDAASDGSTRLGQATERAATASRKWGEEQRTALSLTQRIRGQILSLTAAYVGLFGVINEARASLDAVTSMQTVTNRMAVAFGGDPQEVSRQLKMVEADADRLGISLRGAAEGYSRFAVAARSGGASAEETFFVFSKMSEVSRVFKLSAEEQKRVFKALEQTMSLGKIQAEELGQLGESLPGAVGMVAKAMQMSPAELFKAMEKGQVSAKNLVLVANEYAKAVRDQVVTASKSWQAELQRLDTSLYKFRQNVGSGGFAEAMGGLAKALSKALDSEEGQKAAQALSDAFSFVANAATATLPVLTGFTSAIADAVNLLKTIGNDLTAFATGITGANTPVKDLTGSLQELGRVLAEIAAVAVLVWMSRFATATVAATSAVRAFMGGIWAAFAGPGGAAAAAVVARVGIEELTKAWKGLNTGAKAFILVGVFEVFKAIGEWAYEASVNVRKFAGGLVGIAKVMAGFATGGREGMMAAYAEVQDYVKALDDEEAANKKRGPAVTQQQVDGDKRTKQELARRGRGELTADTIRASDRPNLPKEPILLNADTDAKAAAKARKEYEALLRTVDRGLDAMELKGAKGGARELEEALAAIDQQYEQLYEKIEQLNESDRKAAVARADAAKELIKANARVEIERKAAQERVTAAIEERDALLEAAKARADTDPSAALSAAQEQVRITAEYRDRILEAADAALLLAQAQGRVADAAKLQATITTTKAFDPAAALRKAEIDDLQERLRVETELRDSRIEAAQLAANMTDPTGLTAAQEQTRILAETQGSLTGIVARLRELAQLSGDLPLVAQLDALNARLGVTNQKLADTRQSIYDTLGSGMAGAFTESLKAFAAWGRGVDDFGDAWARARDAVRQFASDFFSMLAQMLAKQAALSILKSLVGGGPGTSDVGPTEPTFLQAGVAWLSNLTTMHNGGVVGGAGGWSQSLPAAAFAGAPRFHSGGLPGLARDEVPAILQKGEEVLAKNDPRNIMNGGGVQGGSTAAPQPFTIVNTFDPEEVVAAGLNDRTFVNRVATNKSQIRKALGL